MAILSTVKKVIPYIKEAAGYVLCHISSQAVEMDDGTLLQDKIESMDSEIDGKANTSHTHTATQVKGLTASRALVSNSSGQPSVSNVTSTELNYLDGVTSNIQNQINTLNSNLTNTQGKFIYEGRVVTIKNSNLYHISKPGYSLIHASNGNWDAANMLVKGIARQGTTDIIFLENAHNGSFQFTLLWARDD